MDLKRIELINNSNLNDLQDNNYLEKLIIKLGFNYECSEQLPKIINENTGGLLIWQYPN
jgi:hypothetical protein